MSANPVTCGHCGTENPPGRDECIECGLPLTRSGGQELRAELEAQENAGLLSPAADPAYGVTWPVTLPPDDPPSRRGD